MELDTSQRRSAARRPGLWHGRYRLGRVRRWAECRVLDVSLGGAAIEVPPDADLGDRRLALQLRPVGTAMPPVTVSAQVRHTRRLPNGAWQVGLAFTDLPAPERTALDRMIRLFAT